jgi:hypothetical protein
VALSLRFHYSSPLLLNQCSVADVDVLLAHAVLMLWAKVLGSLEKWPATVGSKTGNSKKNAL